MPIRSNRATSPRTRAGFSLFEAVVAIAIVGMTAVGALESAGSNMRTAEKAKRAVEAEELAASRIEFIDLMTDRELQAVPDSVATGKFTAPLDEYSWKMTSTPLDEQAGVYDIRIGITWATGNYTVRTYAYRQPALATRR